MARALRESAQEAGISVSQQETGIVDNQILPQTETPYFGPATRNDYDQGEWAMVPTRQEQSSNNVRPAASLRTRDPGAPAFLVKGYNPGGPHRLGGLLTVLNQIPLARNILLQCGSEAASYGYNNEWWDGREIMPPGVLSSINNGDLEWGDSDVPKPNFEEELHRLMAFLDPDRS